MNKKKKKSKKDRQRERKIKEKKEMVNFLNNSFKNNSLSSELCDVFSLGVTFL